MAWHGFSETFPSGLTALALMTVLAGLVELHLPAGRGGSEGVGREPRAGGGEDLDVHRLGVLRPAHVDRDRIVDVDLGRRDLEVARGGRNDDLGRFLPGLVEGDVSARLGDDELVKFRVLLDGHGEHVEGLLARPFDVLPVLDLAPDAEEHPGELVADRDGLLGERSAVQLVHERLVDRAHADHVEPELDVAGVPLGDGFHDLGRRDVAFDLGERVDADPGQLVGRAEGQGRAEDQDRDEQAEVPRSFHDSLLVESITRCVTKE